MRLNGCMMQIAGLFSVLIVTLLGLVWIVPTRSTTLSPEVITAFATAEVAVESSTPVAPTAAPVLPSATFTPLPATNTALPTFTPTLTPTNTPSATHTPTETPTSTPTPTDTSTPAPTDTPTPTATFTPTNTPTITPTFTPTFTPTPVIFCRVRSNRIDRINLRSEPSINASRITQLAPGTEMNVIDRVVAPDTFTWFLVETPLTDSMVIEDEAAIIGDIVRGWMRGDLVVAVGEDTDCQS